MSFARRPRVSHLRVIAATTLALLVGATAARAIDENLTKGATNNHVFESGMWGENIDLLNGGLNLTIPIGPTYQVASDVSFQLKLSYSSKVWHIEDTPAPTQLWQGNQHHRARSRLQGRGQAGLGFMLQLGRYIKRANSAMCLTDTDGSRSHNEEEGFEDATGAMHAWQVEGGDSTRGAADGSYLKIDPNRIKVPDGTQYVLGPEVDDILSNSDPNWPRCENVSPPYPTAFPTYKAAYDIHTNDYRGRYVTRIEGKDRNPTLPVTDPNSAYNRVEIEYEPADGMKHLMKRITPVRNGVADHDYEVTFENSLVFGGQTLATGYVKSVTLPVFSTNPSVRETATYTFNYTRQDVHDLHVGSSDANDPYNAVDNGDDTFEQELLLTSITFPEGFTMSFGYEDSSWPSGNAGILRSRTLPTGAKIEYEYDYYLIRPKVCSNGVPSVCPAMRECAQTHSGPMCTIDASGGTIGVSSKTVIPDPDNPSQTFTWSYERTEHALGRPNPAAVVTTDPFGNDTVTYFHADNYDANVPYDCGTQTCYYPHNLTWKNGLQYKTEYYRGSYQDTGNLLRTEYQNWDSDVLFQGNPTLYRHTRAYMRVTESGTILHDDGGKTVRTVNDEDEWDGLGKFRKTTTYGFDGLPYQIQRTDYTSVTDPNSSCLGLSKTHCDNWILGTHSYSEVLDPSGAILQRSEFAYDGLGRLTAQKDVLAPATGAGPGNPHDLDPGDIKTELKYQGDPTCPTSDPNYPSGNVCYKKVSGYDAAAGVFEEKYTYQVAQVGSQQYSLPFLATRTVGQFSWKAEDREVDISTGLTRISRDPSGIKTTFDYDKLGRLVAVVPDTVADPGGITELPATLTYPDARTTILEQAISSTNKIYSKFNFDKLGRLVQVDKRQADGSLTSQKTRFDIAGRVTWQGEWGDPNTTVGDPSKGTTFDYLNPVYGPSGPTIDPFGRVHKVTTADGKITQTSYEGMSSTVTVEGIQTSYSPVVLQNSSTRYEKDAFGRLTRVLAPRTYTTNPSVCAYSPAGADAYYDYDRLDRLTSVRLESVTNLADPACPTNSQNRSFSYDALGRQTTATNPENGTVSNTQYDAAGNLLKRSDQAGSVFTYTYDPASRLLKAWLDKPGADPNALILDNTYDQTGAVFGYGAGKLTTALSNDDLGQEILREEFRYNGMNGRLSQDSRKHGRWDPAVSSITSQAEIVMSLKYNSLGLLSQLTYPEKPGLARTVLSPQLTYENGYLIAVADPSRGALVESITYNTAGGVRKIKTRGSVETDVAPDSRNRPGSITVTKLGGTPVTHFASGAYAYDGAGNVTQIGTDTFAYDTLNRLILAYLTDPAIAGKAERMQWNFDSLGNMSQQERKTETQQGVANIVTNKFSNNLKNQIASYEVTRQVGDPDPNVPMQYDGNGNVTVDRNYEYKYDGRNRLGEVYKHSDGALVAKYTYDASGYRISKYEAGSQMTTYYLRDASGQTLSEFRRPNRPGTPSWLKDYVYAAGRHVAMVENEVPAAPGGVTTSASAAGQSPYVSISWTASSEPDISGYLVTRSCCWMFEEPPDPVDFDVTSPSLYDTTVTENIDYTYYLAAYDSAGRISESYGPFVVRPGDVSVPSAPTAGTAVAGDGQVTLNWSGPSNADLQGYRIYRKPSSSSTWQPVGPVLHKLQTSFTDTTAANDTEFDYQVKAVDTAGLMSAGVPATPNWRRTPLDTTPPEVPQELFAVAGSSQIELTWRASLASDFSKFQVFRSEAPINPASPGTPSAEPTQALLTDASSVTANTRFYYRIRAVDLKDNVSNLSDQLEVLTRETASALPPPTISSTQAQDWVWSYCYTYNDTLSVFVPDNDCYLPQVYDAVSPNHCYTDDDPATPDEFGTLICNRWTHDNAHNVVLGWDPAATGADLVGFRVYGRKTSTEPFQLRAEYPEPHFEWVRKPGVTSPTKLWDFHPLAFDEDELDLHEYRYQDYAASPDNACQDMTYRVSAVANLGGMQKESVLSTAQVVVPKTVQVPENLTVSVEPVLQGGPYLTELNCFASWCVNDRLNPQYYGMTLSWSPGGSSCAGLSNGYHVYRHRKGGGTAIRMTRDPLAVPVYRVEYLPLSGPKSVATKAGMPAAFSGFAGFHGCGQLCGGDLTAPVYAVQTIDGVGAKSKPSQGIVAHTETIVPTNGCSGTGCATCFSPPCNNEYSTGLSVPGSVLPPNPPSSLHWSWHFDRDPNSIPGQYDPDSDVGPIGGNWALVKWTLPSTDATHGPANDFRLMRQAAADPNFYEVTVDGHYLDPIPGDDGGIREFLWRMPLELACQDANYLVRAVDLYGNPQAPAADSAAIPVLKQKLVPENVGISAAPLFGYLKMTWNALPACQAGSNSHYVMSYTMMEKMVSGSPSCTGTVPGASTFTTAASQSSGTLTEMLFQQSQTNSYWYALRADWSDGASEMSPPICVMPGGQSQAPPGMGSPTWDVDRRLAGMDRFDDASASLEARPAVEGKNSGALIASPHRSIGQSGGSNPAVALYFYHLDHLGTPRVITDVSGNVVSKHKYLPFGEELSAPPTMNSHKFTGHERDTDTGLDYVLARYYASTLGRFLSPDPSRYEEVLMRPASFNRYSYSRNNPIRFIDSAGLFSTENHISITRTALGSSSLSRITEAKIIKANLGQDKRPFSRVNSKAHGTGFGNDTRIVKKAENYAEKQLEAAKRAAADGDLDKALNHIGKGLHTIQDLVAHKDFPDLIDNLKKLDEHRENDENPSDADRADATEKSEKYFEEFWNSLSEEQKEDLQNESEESGLSDGMQEWLSSRGTSETRSIR